jgi:hypothetical protein
MKRITYYTGIVLIFILLLRLPLISIPFFNWDEGECALSANFILDGGVAYRDVVFHEAPLREYIFALIFMFFGKNNMIALHSVLIFLVLFISVILYFISTLTGRGKEYLWVALFFGLFSHTYETDHMMGFQTEWIAILFTTAGAYLFLRHIFRDKYLFLFLSGIFFGLSFFSRPTAILDYLAALLFCGIFIFIAKKNITALIKAAALMIAGFSLVIMIFVCYFYFNNALKDFFFYFWKYNNYYVSIVPLFEKITSAAALFFKENSFLRVNFLLLIFFIAGSFTAVSKFFYNSRKIDRELFIDFYLICWGIFSYIGTVWSGRNSGHYFIMMLPALCLVSGRTIQSLFDSLHFNAAASKKYNIKIFIAVIIIAGMLSPLTRYRNRLGTCKFYLNRRIKIYALPNDLIALTEYIKKNSAQDEKIFAWGYYPQIYILSNRTPASRYVPCNFLTGLMGWANSAPEIDTSDYIVPGSWEILMDELRRNLPVYIVDTSPGNFYCYGKYPPGKFKLLSDFLKANYILEKEFFNENEGLSFKLFRRIS